MITKIVPRAILNGIIRCIEHQCPMTITYVKDDKNVKEGDDKIVVRTIEPYEVVVLNGYPLVRALDRERKAPRSFRIDRITAYTVHTRGKWLLEH